MARDLSREELYELWEQGRNKDRPQFVREYRESFVEHLGETTAGHLPAPDASTFAYRQFLNSYKGAVTTQLGASDTSDGDESGGE